MDFIKQYGLERTGTNYVKALIELNTTNCRVLANLFGLKHEIFNPINYDHYHPKNDKHLKFGQYTDITKKELLEVREKFKNNDVYYLVTFKDPYSWIISYNNCHWIRANNGPLTIDKTKRYIDRWNSVYGNWVESLPKDKTIFISYDDLIKDSENEIKNITKKFNLNFLGDFKDIDNNMWPGTDVHGSKNISKAKFTKKDYYLNKQYMNELSNEIKNYVKNNIDNNIMEKMYNGNSL